MAEIRVFYQDRFLCRAICQELAGQTISLKEIEKANLSEVPIQECRTVFYTPPVSASVGRIEKEVMTLFAAFSYLVEAANQHHQGKEEFLVARRFSHLIELLMLQVEHILDANELQVVTKEVGETARENLIIGPN